MKHQSTKKTSAVEDLSQVKLESTKTKQWLIHFSVGLFVIVMLFMSFTPKKNKNTNLKTQQTADSQSYQDELKMNLANMKKTSSQIKVQLSQLNETIQDNRSEEYLARQNAPTNMYSQTVITSNEQTTVVLSANEAQKIAHPGSTITSGEFMHAILETAINSDLPGKVRAIVSQPVYPYVGHTALIPAGSRLIGEYDSAILEGQNRVLMTWQRLILPDGTSIAIDSPSTDAIGRGGQGANYVNRHFIARFGQATLLSIMGAGVANYDVGSMDQTNSSSAYRTAIAQSFQQSAQQSLQNTTPPKPTLHIQQGSQINIFVAKDLDFYNVLRDTHD